MKIEFHMVGLYYIVICFLFSSCKNADQRLVFKTENGFELQVPDGFEIETIADSKLVDYPMFATLDPTGRLFVFESIGNVYETSQEAIDTPQFQIRLLTDHNGDGIYDHATVFADKLSFPQGGVFYKGSLYATSAPDLIKLTDTDNDGIADQREVILSGWVLNVNANSLIGPFMGPDGWLYMSSAIEGFDVMTKEGQQLKGETARIWKVRPDGSDLQWIAAGGMNNPVELAFTPAGEVMGNLTFFVDPQRGLRDALTYWTEGGVYGKKNNNIARDRLPLTGDLMPVVTSYSRVAPSGLGYYHGDALGEEFKDNLFSAQFNTHRIIRHRLIRNGGSFSTDDETFLSTDQSDFHPTDVFEGGDGSLIVVETGGWFIMGCPLSQVSKPKLEGGIYRVKKKSASKVRDPYGNKIHWSELSVKETADLYHDPRVFVRDRAVETMVDFGDQDLSFLKVMLDESRDADVRTKAIFTLYRIGSPAATAMIAKGYNDSSIQVRVAAARCTGLIGEPVSKDFFALLTDDSEAVRRQAATSLGMIGDPANVGRLLATAEGEDDRFVLHAITYALIKLEQREAILPALLHPDPSVGTVALITLDQMNNSSISQADINPFLNHTNTDLREVGLWVASHHPELSPSMMTYISQKLKEPSDEESNEKTEQLLASFCGNTQTQDQMARWLITEKDAVKLKVISGMIDCPTRLFPESWLNALSTQLDKTENLEIKSMILDLIRSRGLEGMSNQISRQADHPKNPAGVRVKAIASLLGEDSQFKTEHFEYLLHLLKSSKEGSIRQMVVNTLGSGVLSEKQLNKISTEYLPNADQFSLPRLIPLFKESSDMEIGMAVVNALDQSDNLDNYTEENIREIFSNFPNDIQSSLQPIIDRLNRAKGERLARLENVENLLESGDEARGRALFFGKATCWTCHTMGDEGVKFGPDLTSIQKDRSTHDILEAILYPSVSFVREFETYHIKTNKQTYTGIILEQNPQFIELGIAPQTSLRIQNDDIIDVTLRDLSLMPQGLGDLLTETELADLVSFLLGEDLIY